MTDQKGGLPSRTGGFSNRAAYALIAVISLAFLVKLSLPYLEAPSSDPKNVAPAAGQVVAGNDRLPCGPIFERVVTVDQLAAAYRSNEAAAQRDYGDRCVAIVGTVEGVYLDIVDDPSVRLKVGADDTLTVGLEEAAYPLAANLQKGQQAYFLCADISEFLGDPTLNKCIFAEPRS